MKLSLSCTIFCLYVTILNNIQTCSGQIQLSPIIGIVEEESTAFIKRHYGTRYTTSIAASYVKFVEGAGARVVPIPLGKDEKYYEDLLSKINGVLFPGGAVYFTNTNGYADSGMIIYKLAKKMNDHGIYFPLWGTCLGFELLSYLSANRREHRADCSSNNQALNLNFKPDFEKSHLFGSAPKTVIDILKNEYVTANFHKFCITEKNLTDFDLNKQWKVLSVNEDKNGFEFISSFEHKKYPFYGVQFHPEKNIYEWIENRNISHTPNAIFAAQYFANFFVNETRQNNNCFSNKREETANLIYNYMPTYTGVKGSVFEQIYLFPQSDYLDKNANNGNGNVNVLSQYLFAVTFTWVFGGFFV